MTSVILFLHKRVAKRLQRFVIFRLLRRFIKELGTKQGVHFEQEKKVKGVR